MSENMRIYDAVRNTPNEAKKTIGGGRLKGFTDINPMYRIKVLTERFGPCGIGWYYTLDERWTEPAGEETLCFVNISLYVKEGGEWSKPIPGTGGSALYTKESLGLRANDEGYKMATTDAISVACKNLGVGADVYWGKDRTKYTTLDEEPPEVKVREREPRKEPVKIALEVQKPELERRQRELKELAESLGKSSEDYKTATEGMALTPLRNMTTQEYDALLTHLTNVWMAG